MPALFPYRMVGWYTSRAPTRGAPTVGRVDGHRDGWYTNRAGTETRPYDMSSFGPRIASTMSGPCALLPQSEGSGECLLAGLFDVGAAA